MIGMTLFTGFDGAGLGMEAAGVEMVAGIEYDAEIAEVAKANGRAVDVIDVRQADPKKYMGIEVLHASPVCTRASNANNALKKNENGTREASIDLEAAQATARFVEALRPGIFTLENVWGYRHFESYLLIRDTLDRLGYCVDVQHLCAADFGVPQTRRRMILRATLGREVPNLPEKESWIGWYVAIEDLIPTLPESQFAPWQMRRLPEKFSDYLLSSAFPKRNGKLYTPKESPAYTVDSLALSKTHAFLVNGGNASRDLSMTPGEEPAFTVENGVRAPTRAFLVDGKLSTSGNEKILQISEEEEEPAGTVVGSHSPFRDARAWLEQGKVVKMTTRALARFQSFPDSYILPEKSQLACKGIGNAVPPLWMQKLYAGLLEGA